MCHDPLPEPDPPHRPQRTRAVVEAALAREREARLMAERALERARRLQALTAALAGALSAEEVAVIVVELGRASIGAHGAYLARLVGDAALELLVTVRDDELAQAVAEEARRVSLSTPAPASDAVREGRTIALSPRAAIVAAYPVIAERPYALADEAWVCAPLLIAGRPTGALFFSFGAPQPFTPDDLAFVEAVTAQCASALERVRLYAIERDARAAAEAEAQMRAQFLSVASHELRTPLAGVKGFAQRLLLRHQRQGHLQDRDLEDVERLLAQAERMQRLIGQLLDLRRIEHGQLNLSWGEVELAGLLRRVAADVEMAAPRHTVHVEGGPSELWLPGDELRLEQVFYNLIGNAVKYSPHGGAILVSLEAAEAAARVRVSDHGLGIPPGDLPQLFGRFFRASNVSADSISGVGIGLYVAQQIVALHHGTIEVVSELGVGSTFTVALPTRRDAPK
jgi:signal transduction histidine kinase